MTNNSDNDDPSILIKYHPHLYIVIRGDKMLKPVYQTLDKFYNSSNDDDEETTTNESTDDNVPAKDDWVNYRDGYSSAEKSFLRKFDSKFPKVKTDIEKEDIGGLDQIVEKLEAFERGIKYPQMYKIMGITPPNGYILSGPPGTGKTYIAKYLANTLEARFIDISLNKFESKWVGQAADTLSDYIEDSRKYYSLTGEKVNLFFDEAEESFKDRKLEGWHGPRVNVLLREMDGMGDNEGIIFGAATNHLDRVDSALLRAGRLDMLLKMPEYNTKALGEVFTAVSNRLNKKAPHHKPYKITDKEAFKLGSLASDKQLLPADVKEIYRLSAESRIKEIINSDRSVFEGDEQLIGYGELEKTLSTYDRDKKNTHHIGF